MWADTKVALGVIPVLYLCVFLSPTAGQRMALGLEQKYIQEERAWQTAKLHQHLEKLPTTSRRGQCSRVGVCQREALCEVGYGFLLWRIPRKWFS